MVETVLSGAQATGDVVMSEGELLRTGWWATGRGWLDNDEYHVWVAHDCTAARVTTMLPFPTWHSTGRAVEPSINCEACGFHSFVALGPPDTGYRCMATWEIDGRWCQRPTGHRGAHRSEMVEWTEYTR